MSKPQHASVERGDSRIEGTLAGGLLHGTARVSVTGAPLAVLGYARGQLFGPATFFYPDGKPSAQLNYIDGQLDGKAVYYAQDGAVQREAHYERGFLSGESITYLPNGVVLERATYRRRELASWSPPFFPHRRPAGPSTCPGGKPPGSPDPAPRHSGR